MLMYSTWKGTSKRSILSQATISVRRPAAWDGCSRRQRHADEVLPSSAGAVVGWRPQFVLEYLSASVGVVRSFSS